MREIHPPAGDKQPIAESRNVDAGLRSQVLQLALPAFGSLIAPPLFMMVDAAIVGSLGTTALAALGAGSTVFSALSGLSFFLAYQTTGVVSRLTGAGNKARALSAAGDNLAAGIVLGIALGALLHFGGEPLLRLFGVSATVTPLAANWLSAVSIGMPGVLGSYAAVGLFRGLQDTRLPLRITLAQVALNALLCWLFVLQLQIGIVGSGFATAIAELAGLAAYLIAINRRLEGGIRQLVPHHVFAVFRSLRDGVPLIWRSVMLRGVLTGVVIAAANLGDESLAAFHVSFTIWYTLALSLDAIAVAAQALIGEAIGRGDLPMARHLLQKMLRWGMWLGAIQGLLVAIASPLLAQIFSREEVVRQLIIGCTLLVGLHQPLASQVFVLDGVLIGAGDTRYLALVHTIAFAVFAPLAIIAVSQRWNVATLWGVMIAFIAVRFGLLWSRSRGTNWLKQGSAEVEA